MKEAKVLFIAQEITPYLPESEIANICRNLPQGIQDRGHEIRTFMPKYGSINERRNQLHEVIRLSGMNLIIDDTDHPLIIKVASIQSARMQVYFIDNDDYFQRNADGVVDEDMRPDNDERSIFFVRGVMETVKKLRWTPDIIHCHCWITALTPLYIKKSYPAGARLGWCPGWPSARYRPPRRTPPGRPEPQRPPFPEPPAPPWPELQYHPLLSTPSS